MKIAYLISAYVDAPHLQRLVAALDDDAVFFIHVDKKVDEAPFRERLTAPNVHFLTQRFTTLWGDFSQVRYQRALLQACLDSGEDVGRLVLLSGTDYPLWSNRRLHAYFEAHADDELLQGICLTDAAEVNAKYRQYCPQFWIPGMGWWINWHLRVKVRKWAYRLGVRKSLTFRRGDRTCKVYKGSDYWAVTPRLARWMLDELERHPEVWRYFSTLFIPSEQLWQSLAFQSPFAAHCRLERGRYESLAALTPLHFIDYGASVRVLTETDWPRLQTSGKMFCRKIRTGESDALMAIIDRKRNDSEERKPLL